MPLRIAPSIDQHFGVFIPSTDKLHEDALRAFARGLESRKIPLSIYDLESGYRPCDILVTFGIGKLKTERGRSVGDLIEAHENSAGFGKHLVIERGFIHRDRYYMVGWGGLNGRADFQNEYSPGDRFAELNVQVAPWRTDGRHIVLCGQIPWDAAVQFSNHVKWCRRTASTLVKLSDRPVVFRPHPLQPTAVSMDSIPVEISHKPTLQDDLVDAWAVVTFNSNAGVEATLAGVPAFVSDIGAMGYSLLNKKLSALAAPAMPDRKQWLFDLAYTQWTLDEMASGRAIIHLWEKQFSPYHRLLRLARNATYNLRASMLGHRDTSGIESRPI